MNQYFKFLGVAAVVAARTLTAQAQAPAENRADPIIQADADFAKLAATDGAEKAFAKYFAVGAINPMADAERPVDRAGMIARMKNWTPTA